MKRTTTHAACGTSRGAVAIAAVLPLLLFACSGSSLPFKGLFGKTESEVETSKPAEQEAPLVYYVGSNGLPLYREPGRNVLAQLPLHQKVLRYRLERGYAYVKVEGTGQEGWLDNAKLLWRLPRQPPAAQAPSPAPAADHDTPAEPDVSEAAPPAEPADSEETAPSEEPPPAEPPAEAPADQPGPVSPSVFEPF